MHHKEAEVVCETENILQKKKKRKKTLDYQVHLKEAEVVCETPSDEKPVPS